MGLVFAWMLYEQGVLMNHRRPFLILFWVIVVGFASSFSKAAESINLEQENHGIQAEPHGCHPALCRYILTWSVPKGARSVVTVQDADDFNERLLACSSEKGLLVADWITYGKKYLFRVYRTEGCDGVLFKQLQPIGKTEVTGGL